MHEKLIVSLVYSIYRTIAEPERWQLILKECEELVNADVCDIAAYDFENCSGEIVAHSGYYGPGYVGLYEREYVGLNPWLRHKHYYETDGAVWVGRDLCPREQLVRTEFYNRWLRPQRLQHRICSTITHEDDTVIYFAALRACKRDDFDRHELNLVQRLIPHMSQVFELQRLLGKQKSAKRQPLLEVAHHVHDAVLLVGPGGKILGANQAGPKLLAQSEAIGASGALWGRINAALETASGHATGPGRLGARDPDHKGLAISIIPLPAGTSPEQDEPAVAIIGRDIPRDPPGSAQGVQAKSSRITWRPLLIRSDKTAASEAVADGLVTEGNLDTGAWTHSLKEPFEQAKTNEERLRAIYDFTHAEARLAVLLACGHALQDCAAKLNVSISTVRTHLQRIFSKTDTHHQGQLVALLLAGPARLSIECVTVDEQSDEYA